MESAPSADSLVEVRAKPCIVVVGTGRSGTSAAAQLLSHLGVSLERSLDAAGEQNPSGFAEDAAIVRMNKALMNALSAGQQLPPNHEAVEAIRPIEKDLVAYIERQAQAHDLWGFKDPRTALYLPLYRRIFNKLRLVPKYVLCLRDPAETVASFVSHYGTDPDLAQLTWFSKNLAVLRESGLNCFILHYEKLLEDPVGQARKLADFVHDGGERPALDEVAILRTVQPALNRSGAMPARITNPLVERLYDGLRTCEGVDFDRTQLRLLVKELSAIEQAFLPWAHLRTRAARPGEQRKADDAKLQLAEAAAKELQATNRQLTQDNARLATERADARLLTEDYQRRAVEAEDRLAAEGKKLAAAEGKRAEAERKREETERKGIEAERKRAETERKRAEVEAARLDKLRQAEWKRMKAEPAYRLGRLIMEAYGRPLAKGLRLPAALLALRADNRRRRAAREALPSPGKRKKK